MAREEIALIADIGSGTSDFSIVRLSPERHRKADRQDDILGNDGVRVGGTDFDRKLGLGLVMPLLGHGSAMKRAGELLSRPCHVVEHQPDLRTRRRVGYSQCSKGGHGAEAF
jgi:molecular chaperone DnaK (HSP70)